MNTLENSCFQFKENDEASKEINGYEGLYFINKSGEIYRNNKRLKTCITHRGYERICLCKKQVQKSFVVHRLVAIAFVENPNNYPEVNHIDGNKLNNRALNLEWVDKKMNMQHALKMGLIKNGYELKTAKVPKDVVLSLREKYESNSLSISERKQVSADFNIAYRTLTDILKRKTYKLI